jgi:hypothetical protein
MNMRSYSQVKDLKTLKGESATEEEFVDVIKKLSQV